MDAVGVLAAQVVAQAIEEPVYVAQVDQERAKWRETFAAKGLDFEDPNTAAACFLAAQILLADLVYLAEETDEPLATFGDLLVSVAVGAAQAVTGTVS